MKARINLAPLFSWPLIFIFAYCFWGKAGENSAALAEIDRLELEGKE